MRGQRWLPLRSHSLLCTSGSLLTARAQASSDSAAAPGAPPPPATTTTASKREGTAAQGSGHEGDAASAAPTLGETLERTRHPHWNSTYELHRQRQRQRFQQQSRRATATATAEAAAPVPAVHPGATDLPPLGAPREPPRHLKWSFLSYDAVQSRDRYRDYYTNHVVPNNTPKPRLPMWASSLTAPSLGRVRLVEETWISADCLGTVDEDRTARFVEWLEARLRAAGHAGLAAEVRRNVLVSLRAASGRGLYAARDVREGEVLFRLPLCRLESDPATLGLTLDAETLAAQSSASAALAVPPYRAVQAALAQRHSEFEPIPHPLFVDQMHLALHLAAQKAAGAASPLAPYLDLLGASNNTNTNATSSGSGEGEERGPLYFDDDHIKELHLGVLDPHTHMEYTDHVSRFAHYARLLHRVWCDELAARERSSRGSVEGSLLTDGAEHPPFQPRVAPGGPATVLSSAAAPLNMNTEDAGAAVPSADSSSSEVEEKEGTAAVSGEGAAGQLSAPPAPPSPAEIEWAMRLVLSRQRMLPGLRRRTGDVSAAAAAISLTEDSLDPFAKAVVAAKWWVHEHVLGTLDRRRLEANRFDPRTIAAVVPLADMLQHAPGGVPSTRVTIETADGRVRPATSATRSSATEREQGRAGGDDDNEEELFLVVRAATDLEALDELTTLFPKCYSVSYTLYRYGCLPLRRREDDGADLLREAAAEDGGHRMPLSNNMFNGEPKTRWERLRSCVGL